MSYEDALKRQHKMDAMLSSKFDHEEIVSSNNKNEKEIPPIENKK